ncbi:MAG: ArgE/DapE family deacylase [Candidatus Hodarchaeales archaeon]|jgi:acetylornithine deacetylase
MNPIAIKISETVDSMKEEIITFIQSLVRTPSLPGEEKAVQNLVASKLKEINLDVAIIPVKREEIEKHPAFCDDGVPFENRLTVVGTWKGIETQKIETKDRFRSLILNGHVDVVSPGNESLWHDSPWSGKVKEGKIYGRGSNDMKAGLSSAIFAVEVLQKLGYHPVKDVIIESVVGEETGGCGTLATIVKGFKADAAIIMEPTQLYICPIQSGALTFKINVAGRSIHACMKNKGISAIEKFYLIFKAISELEKRRHLDYHNSLYEDPMNVAPISIGTLSSGDWHSTVPGELIAEGRYGVFPGESIEKARQVFGQIVEKVAQKDEWLKEHPPVVEWVEGQFESGETKLDEPIIKQVSNCHENIFRKPPEIKGVTYGADLRLFTNHAKIPTILYGPGDLSHAHTIDEFISIDEVMKAIKVLSLTIINWSGGRRG